MNVRELVDLLRCYPPDTQLGVLVLTPSGAVIDMTGADVITVDATVGDDGTRRRVWITGAGDSNVPTPTLVSWPCRCGHVLVVNEYDTWPSAHLAHLRDLDT